jgi:alkylhydroperoxidase/carboxymuconolactone decarboxylase family protein YurZ
MMMPDDVNAVSDRPGVQHLAEATPEAGDLLARLLAAESGTKLLDMVEGPMRELWIRPGLDRKWRRLVTVSALAVLDRPRELRTHISGALKDGCTETEIAEALLHIAFYAGIPAGVDAMAALLDVLSAQQDGGER